MINFKRYNKIENIRNMINFKCYSMIENIGRYTKNYATIPYYPRILREK